jgi:hypothetical protein
MIRLPQSLAAWNTPDFEIALKRELEQLGAGQLPLQQALSSSSYALDDALCVMIISAGAAPAFIRAKVGVFFSGITAGCSCPDDPTPDSTQSEYCELTLTIDKATAEVAVSLTADEGPASVG